MTSQFTVTFGLFVTRAFINDIILFNEGVLEFCDTKGQDHQPSDKNARFAKLDPNLPNATKGSKENVAATTNKSCK